MIIDGKLLMFLMRAHDDGWGLGFNTSGWGAVLIDDLAADPEHWQVRNSLCHKTISVSSSVQRAS